MVHTHFYFSVSPYHIISQLDRFHYATVTATLVSKANASGNQEELQDAVSQALLVGFYISLVGSALMLKFPEKILSSVLKGMPRCLLLLLRPTYSVL